MSPDAHTPSPDDTADDEYILLQPNSAAIESFLGTEGIDIEIAVVKFPSGDTPGSLSVQFWTGDPAHAEQEGGR